MAAVATLHLSGIALYYVLEIARASAARQRGFAWAWICLTTVLVFWGLQRIKRARRAR